METTAPPDELNPLNPQQEQEKQDEQEQQQQQQQQQQQDHIVVPISLASPRPPPLPRPYFPTSNLPNPGLIDGYREEYVRIGVALYEASRKGDWKAAEAILDRRPELVRFAITENYDTPLHVAASEESTKCMDEFVQNLVNRMENWDLELQNRSNNTALSLAAASGNVETAKIILQKNKYVVEIPGSQGMKPLYVAALYARSSMVSYLYDNSSNLSGNYWTDQTRGWVLLKCVEGDSFDVAAKILKHHTALTSNKRLLRDVLLVLAKKTSAFVEKKPHNILRIVKSICRGKVGKDKVESEALQVLKKVWEIISIMPRKDIDYIIRGPPLLDTEGTNPKTMYPSRVLFVAAKSGNTKFILQLFQSYPDLAWRVDDHGQTIFHIAVIHRDAETYNLLYHIGAMKDIVTPTKDEEGNNMLHLVAKGATTHNVSGVALQMQQELLWYKEVEQMIPPASRTKRNKHGETPHDIFKKDHEHLLTEGGKWMKDTASQCMVVATLIATIVFAAAFTLPGGYDQNTGIPMFRQKAALIIFVVADAISLIFSSTSVLLFLSMLTSRHAESDFLDSLPKKLFFGLSTLFLSVTTMMIAFSASFFILYNKSLKWVPIMIVCVATMPVVLFAFLQFHLLGDVLFSTYRSRSLFKANKHV